MLFKDLGLSAELLSAVEKQGYEEATPIQQQAIPLILEGKDVLAGAQILKGHAQATVGQGHLLAQSNRGRPVVQSNKYDIHKLFQSS